MNIEIYGIEEETYKCPGCDMVKRMLNEAGLGFTFKRIVKLNEKGFPERDEVLFKELNRKIPVSRMVLPYIFINGQQIRFSDFKAMMESKFGI